MYDHKFSPALCTKLESIQDGAKVPIIVQVRNTSTDMFLSDMKSRWGDGIVPGYAIKSRQMVSLLAPKSLLPLLCQSSSVGYIWSDDPVFLCGGNVLYPDIKMVKRFGFSGLGQVIGIIDTGVFNHPQLNLKERLAGWTDLVAGKAIPYDDHGHGTAIAGWISSSALGAGEECAGIASDAKLAVVKAFDKTGCASASRVLAGLNWVYENRERLGISVLGLAFGKRQTDPAPSDPMAMMVKTLWQNGVVVVSAAGNNGPEPSTVNSPGIEECCITVGTAWEPGGDGPKTWPNSSRGPTLDGIGKPDVISFGYPTGLKAGSGYEDHSPGSSSSVAVVSGLAALLLQRDPSLTPDDVKKIIVGSAEDTGDDGTAQGAGLVKVYTALAHAGIRHAGNSSQVPDTGRRIRRNPLTTAKKKRR